MGHTHVIVNTKFKDAVSTKIRAGVLKKGLTDTQAAHVFQVKRDMAVNEAQAYYTGLVRAITDVLDSPQMAGFKVGGLMTRNVQLLGKPFTIRGRGAWRKLSKAWIKKPEASTTYWRKTGDLAVAFTALAAAMGPKLVSNRLYARKAAKRTKDTKYLAQANLVINYPGFSNKGIDLLVRAGFATGQEQVVPAWKVSQAERDTPLMHLLLANRQRPWIGRFSADVGRAFIEALKSL